MQAVRFAEYGDENVLSVVTVPTPVPGPGQVLVRVRAAGINPGEAKIRAGLLHSRWSATLPSGQGSDLAGVVAAAGPGVTAFAPGDEVMGYTDNRASQAEYVLAELARLVAAGQLEVPIAATFPLDSVRDACRLLAQGHTRGKIVLIP